MLSLCRYLGPVQLETSSRQYNFGNSRLLELIKSLGELVISLRFSVIIQKQIYPCENFCCEKAVAKIFVKIGILTKISALNIFDVKVRHRLDAVYTTLFLVYLFSLVYL